MTVPGRCRRGSYGAISGDWRDHPEIVLSFPRVACLPTLRPACIHVGPIDSSSLSTPDFSSEYVVDRAGSECVITTTGGWSILMGQERRLAVERRSIGLFTVRWKKSEAAYEIRLAKSRSEILETYNFCTRVKQIGALASVAGDSLALRHKLGS